MDDNWYLYVDKDTLQICKVSPVLEDGNDCHIITIEKDLGLKFINGPHLVNEYVVYYDGTIAHFIKKEKSKDVVVPFFYSPLMISDTIENADIQLTIKHGALTVTLRKELAAYAMTIYGNVDKTKQIVQFYVSAKNDPNELYEILHVDMMELIKGNSCIFDVSAYDPNKISFFTRKIFDSYGLTK